MQDETGGYCPKCGTVWSAPGRCKCVGISEPINETHSAIKSAVAKRNEEEYKRIWNAAIEAAANEAKKYLNSINLKGVKTHAAVMRLKK